MRNRFSLAALLLTIAVVVGSAGTAQAGTLTLTITVDGNPAQTYNAIACGTGLCIDLSGVNQNGISFGAGSGATSNTPGTPLVGFTQDSNLSVTNNNSASTTVTISEVSTGFDVPNPSSVSGSATLLDVIPAANGFSFTDSASAVDSASNTVTLGPCTLTVAPGVCAFGPVLFNATVPFTLNENLSFNVAAGQQFGAQANIQANVVPEPSSMLLFGTGLSGVAAMLRRRTKKQ